MENIDETAFSRFMEHMGHSRSIDRNVYAVPPAMQILQTTGPIIDRLDTVDPLCVLPNSHYCITLLLIFWSLYYLYYKFIEIIDLDPVRNVTVPSVYCQDSAMTAMEVCRQGTGPVSIPFEPNGVPAAQAHACPAFRTYPEESDKQHRHPTRLQCEHPVCIVTFRSCCHQAKLVRIEIDEKAIKQGLADDGN